ncbi:MAG: hypothetical protein PHG89_06665 [Gallionella sp.]|nr:hypothetical protein [Gallionella sp.]
MGVTIIKKPSLPVCWGGDDKFEKWAAGFRTKYTYVRDSDAEGKLSRAPLHQTLEQIRRMKVWVGDGACFEKNLIFACYQAAHTKKPEEYAAARARQEREKLLLQLQSQMKHARGVLGFITNNPSTVIGCYRKSNGMPSEGRNLVLATPDEKMDMLAGLLAEYEYGLAKDAKDELAIGVHCLFGFGPFLYDKEALDIEKREAPNVAELGLIFHLTYLFRYFTAESEPRQSKDNTNDSGFVGDELRVYGEMLNDGGKPYYAQVAALVNATLGKKFHSDDMKLRLKDLLAPPKRASAKLPGKKKYIEFAGWEINSPA